MIDFREYANKIKEIYNIKDEAFPEKLVRFLVDNHWFGIKPVWRNDILFIEPSMFETILPMVREYFESQSMTAKEKAEKLLYKLTAKMPDTSTKLRHFYKEFSTPVNEQICLTSFLLKYLPKDICFLNDAEVQSLLKEVFVELSKQEGDVLAFYLSWLKEHYKTKFVNDYAMLQRQEQSDKTAAYDIYDYLRLLYYLFNEEYIETNDMYTKAASSRNYVDTWLFLSLHFICALRNTDLVRIHHPRLTMPPETVIQQIKDKAFSDEDARLTLYSITWRLNVLPLTPNKTKKHSNIPFIKLCVPESVEVHMGKLFALAEAHYQISNKSSALPLIRVISDYERINRYMGEEIGSFFINADFRSRAANKAYLQSIFMLTEDILENDDEFNVKGYILAALARSHKGSYGEFASTTATYLKDAKLSGFTPEFVARELFERGVLSFVPSMLLKIITNGSYDKLTVGKQTELIQALDLTPYEIENVVNITNQSKSQSVAIVKELLSCLDSSNRRSSILSLLHRIGNGDAVSKQNECLCLLSAMKKICPYSERSNCVGCRYEISTKSTVFLMVNEYKRLLNLYNNTSDERLQGKYKYLLKTTVLPVMDELLQCIKEQYGSEALASLEKIIKESTKYA